MSIAHRVFRMKHASPALAGLALACIVGACSDNVRDARAPSAQENAARSIHASSTAWESMASSDRPLSGGASSKSELVEKVLDRFAHRDTVALGRLLVDKDEFLDIIYPELGIHYASARDTREETKAFLWEHQYLNARKGLFKALREVGGKEMAFVDMRFADGEKHFRTYKLHEGTEVDVRTADGQEATLLALGTIIERDGRFKLLSYRDID